MQKMLAIGEYRGILIVWPRWYTINMSNAILLHTLTIFAVGSTLVYYYNLPGTTYI